MAQSKQISITLTPELEQDVKKYLQTPEMQRINITLSRYIALALTEKLARDQSQSSISSKR